MKCSTPDCQNLADWRTTAEKNVVLPLCGVCATTARKFGHVRPLTNVKKPRR
jgi:hypothetical protein